MKKYIGAGLLAVGLIVAGGTGAYIEKTKENAAPASFVQEMGSGNMAKMMNSANSNSFQSLVEKQQKNGGGTSFEQMLPYMKKMHPNLNDQQLKDLYDQMMGPNGACSKMMGITNDTTRNTSSNGNL